MDFAVGACQLNCTLCSEVCPTGAIQKIPIERKLGVAEYAEAGPIKVGTAFFNRGQIASAHHLGQRRCFVK